MSKSLRLPNVLTDVAEEELLSIDGGLISLNTITPLRTAWVLAAPRTPEGLGNVSEFLSSGQTYDATTLSGGAIRAGLIVSTTVTVKLTRVALPASSVATHVTTVAPAAKVVPARGVHSAVIERLSASVATGDE